MPSFRNYQISGRNWCAILASEGKGGLGQGHSRWSQGFMQGLRLAGARERESFWAVGRWRENFRESGNRGWWAGWLACLPSTPAHVRSARGESGTLLSPAAHIHLGLVLCGPSIPLVSHSLKKKKKHLTNLSLLKVQAEIRLQWFYDWREMHK